MSPDANGHLPDSDLLARYAAGDARAARALVQRLTPRAFAFATRVLGNRAEAEEVVQEAMLRLWAHAPEWRDGEARVSTWLYKVVSNLCTDRLRARRPQATMDAMGEIEDGAPTADEQTLTRQRATALQAALEQLPDRQRQAVVLRHLEGLANPEIAVIMDIGVEAVESLTARGKRTLAAALAADKEGLGYVDT
jgi:RNA polymerase sigma-70 factor (ECF subfamily)